MSVRRHLVALLALVSLIAGFMVSSVSIAGADPAPAVPDAPTSLVAYRGYSSAEIAFTAGADGGLPITNYKYSTDNGSSWTAFSPAVTSSSVTIGGLTNGTTYSVRLRAVNMVGDGAISDAVSVTPAVLDAVTWTARSAAEARPWQSVTYGNGLFVAVGNGQAGDNWVMTSPDGVTWTSRTAPPGSLAPNTWSSVTYGNGVFVAVGGSGTFRVMTSPDGVTWTAQTPAEVNQWASVTYGKGLFVAVANTGTKRVMTSTDGVTWTARTAAANNWSAVGYGNGLFVAVGGGSVMTSPDGVTWTSRTAPPNTSWFSVTYGNGRFVAVGSSFSGIRVLTSPDGETWTARSAVEENFWQSVTYANGVFVAVASTGTYRVMTSPDGETWTGRTAAEANSWFEVTYANGVFVAVGGASSPLANRVMTSSLTEPPIAPAAPTSLIATPGDGSASIAFTPGADGGAAITNYEYQLDGAGSWVALSPADDTSPVTISGLTNSTAYTVKLRAVNSVGSGAESVASDSFTPRTTPSAPSITSVTAGDSTVSVVFTAGATGGSVITDFEYQLNGAGSWFSLGTTSSPASIGVTNGVAYTVKLRAVNVAGSGAESDASDSFTPRTTPSAPIVVATAGDGSASISFTAGADGGASITKYQYQLGSGSWVDAVGTSSPISISGLTNGTNYNIKLRAVNSAGDGAASDAVSVTPRTVPGAPSITSVTPGDSTVSVAFTAGATGGSSITDYEYQLNGSGSWFSLGTTSSPASIGVTNGLAYTVKLRAVNVAGSGAASDASGSFTPRTTPSAPIVVATAGDGSASISFTAGADGGSAITKYQYRLGAGSWVDAGLTSPIAITGLVNFTTYSIQVRAVNAAGAGAASVAVTARPKLTGPTIGVAYSSGKQGAQVGFAFTRPAGSTLVGFTVRAYAKGTDTVVSSCQTLPNSRSCYVPSLTSGAEYDIRVQAYFTLAGETKVRETLESATSTVRVNI